MIRRYKLIPEPDESLKDMCIGVAALSYLLVMLGLTSAAVWNLVQAFQGVNEDAGALGAACFSAVGVMIGLIILVEALLKNRP